MRERPVWAPHSDSEDEDGTAAFLSRYTAAVTRTKSKEPELCVDCGYERCCCTLEDWDCGEEL